MKWIKSSKITSSVCSSSFQETLKASVILETDHSASSYGHPAHSGAASFFSCFVLFLRQGAECLRGRRVNLFGHRASAAGSPWGWTLPWRRGRRRRRPECTAASPPRTRRPPSGAEEVGREEKRADVTLFLQPRQSWNLREASYAVPCGKRASWEERWPRCSWRCPSCAPAPVWLTLSRGSCIPARRPAHEKWNQRQTQIIWLISLYFWSFLPHAGSRNQY